MSRTASTTFSFSMFLRLTRFSFSLTHKHRPLVPLNVSKSAHPQVSHTCFEFALLPRNCVDTFQNAHQADAQAPCFGSQWHPPPLLPCPKSYCGQHHQHPMPCHIMPRLYLTTFCMYLFVQEYASHSFTITSDIMIASVPV